MIVAGYAESARRRLLAAPFGPRPVVGIDLIEFSTGRRTALDNVGPAAWVDDLVSRLEADPDDGEAASPEAASLTPVLAADGLARCPLCAETIQPGAKICRFCRADFRVPAPALSGTAGSPRFLGDADLGSGLTVRRLFDAACYVVAGIAFIAIGATTEGGGWGVVGGVAAMLYGAKIALTTTSYWVSSLIYVVAVLAVAAAIGGLQTNP